MFRTNNSITVLLVVIVVILIVGVGAALYYVLDLEWFKAKEVTPYTEPEQVLPYVEQPISTHLLDKSKRKYDIILTTNEFDIIVYKDGMVGVTMIENEKYKAKSNYETLLNTERKVSLENIVRAYSASIFESEISTEYILLIDEDGNLYKMVDDSTMGDYAFIQIDGVTGIVDIKQAIEKDKENTVIGLSIIAIDKNGDEILIDKYLQSK